MSPEEIFDRECLQHMKEWDLEFFKNSHPTLHHCIMTSIRKMKLQTLEELSTHISLERKKEAKYIQS